jgi:hypothetical protein
MSEASEGVNKAFAALADRKVRLIKDGAQPPPKRARSEAVSLGAQKSKAGLITACRPDGRVCRLCGAKDSDMDIVIHSSSLKWGYQLSADGRNQGKVCFYCIRVFNARYKCKFAIAALEIEMGRSIDIRNEFMAFLETCKQIFIKAGSHDISVDWGEASRKVVTQKQRAVTSFEEPPDDFWPINEYIDRFGDPSANGKGHTRKTLQGIDGVLVPNKGPYKLRRKHQQLVDATVTMDSGNFTLGENQAESVFADISAQLFSTRATGMSLSTLIGGSSSSSTPSSLTISSSPSSVPQCDEHGDGMMVFGFGPTREASSQQAVIPSYLILRVACAL